MVNAADATDDKITSCSSGRCLGTIGLYISFRGEKLYKNLGLGAIDSTQVISSSHT